MAAVLRYGFDSQVTLDLPPSVRVTECGPPPGEPLDDPAAAMAAALLDPLDFPSLSRCVIPGDRVTVALDLGLPQLSALVAGVVDALLSGGVDPSHITLLRSIEDARASAEDPRDALPPQVAEYVELATHDPDLRAELRYLAASNQGKAIYLNRRIQEADLVLPLGCLRVDSALGYHGIHGGLFPTFSDRQTIERFRAAAAAPSRIKRRRRDQVDEVAWLLGISMTVQVVPAAGGRVLHVLAGEVGHVLRRGQTLCEHAWRRRVPHRADLVVAAIDGDQREQTWDNVARALSAARHVVVEGGAIALCTDLADDPRPALRRLGEHDEGGPARRAVPRDRSPDALPAAELLRARNRATIYLLSRLEEEVVEQLGVAPVRDATELARLSSHFESCILLPSAQYAVVTAQPEQRP